MADRKEIRAVHRAWQGWLFRRGSSLSQAAFDAAQRVRLGLEAAAADKTPHQVIVTGIAEDVAVLERERQR